MSTQSKEKAKEMPLEIYRCLYEYETADMFRSEMSHMYKRMEAREFIESILRYDMVQNLWAQNKFYDALFTLAYLDYVSEDIGLGLFPVYEKYRSQKLDHLAIPGDIMLKNKLGFENAIEDAINECKDDPLGRYFYRFNILYKEE